jgi:hypothetical protein
MEVETTAAKRVVEVTRPFAEMAFWPKTKRGSEN